MISTMDSQYPISLVKIDPLTLELLSLRSDIEIVQMYIYLTGVCYDLNDTVGELRVR